MPVQKPDFINLPLPVLSVPQSDLPEQIDENANENYVDYQVKSGYYLF